MKYDEFINQVQHRASLASREEAVRAIRITLEVLGQRISEEEANDLASQLPTEIGVYLKQVEGAERFDLDEFFKRVSEKEGIDMPDAVYHARVVISVLQEAVSPGEIEDVRAQLPEEFDSLFEAGDEGAMP